MRGNIEATGFELLCVAAAAEKCDQFRSEVACFYIYALMRYQSSTKLDKKLASKSRNKFQYPPQRNVRTQTT